METSFISEAHNRLWRLFLTVHTQAIDLIEKDLEDAGLPSLSWYSVLWSLEKAPEKRLRLHELAQQLFLSRSNITRLIDRMETAGLLCRKNCLNDRRGAFAYLNPEGLEMRQKMWSVYNEGIARYFADCLKEEEVSVLTETFERISLNIGLFTKLSNKKQETQQQLIT